LPEVVFAIGEQYYNKALYIRSDPNLPEAEAKDYFQKTINVWERVITELPASAEYTPRFYYITAVLYSQELAEYQKGIDYYTIVVKNWPDYQYAWHAQYFIGMYYEKLINAGGISELEANPLIEQAYKAVVDNYPDSESTPYAAQKLGWMNFHSAQWVEAAKYFEFFLEKSEDNQAMCSVVSPLGPAYEQMGELHMAAEVYRIFIETADPNNPLVKTVKARLEELEGVNK